MLIAEAAGRDKKLKPAVRHKIKDSQQQSTAAARRQKALDKELNKPGENADASNEKSKDIMALIAPGTPARPRMQPSWAQSISRDKQVQYLDVLLF